MNLRKKLLNQTHSNALTDRLLVSNDNKMRKLALKQQSI